MVVGDRVRQRLGGRRAGAVAAAAGLLLGGRAAAGGLAHGFSPVRRRLVDGVVDLALGHAGPAGHVEDRVLAGHPAGLELGDEVAPQGRVGADLGGVLGPLDDQRHLAADAVRGPDGELPQRAAPYLLMGLGQLPADRAGAVVAERVGERGERGLGPVRRLEEHHRALLGGQPGQPPGALPGLAGQEALEAEPVHRQARDGQRGEHRGRAGDGGDGDVLGDRGGHQAVARVGDAGHPRVGHQQHPLAVAERVEQLRGARGLVALEVGHHPPGEGDAEVVAEPLEPAGVLGGDDVGSGQLLGQPRRRVADPADRGGGQHQQAGALGSVGRSGSHGSIMSAT